MARRGVGAGLEMKEGQTLSEALACVKSKFYF